MKKSSSRRALCLRLLPQRAGWMATFFAAVLLSPAVLAQPAQGFLLGVHGGAGGGGGDPGAVSIVDASTAALTILDTPAGVGKGLGGIAVSASGVVYVAVAGGGNGQLITVDPNTGALLSTIGNFTEVESGEGCLIGDLAMHPNGTLYGITANGDGPDCGAADDGGYLVTINTSTAAVTIIGRDSSLNNDQGGLAITSDGTIYYKLGWSGRENNELYILNPATAAFQSTIILDDTFSILGLGAAPDGTLYGSFWQDNDEALWVIDPNTGNTTRIGTTVAANSTSAFVQDVAWYGGAGATATPVPTMSMYGFMLTTLGLLLVGTRRLRSSFKRS